MKRQDSQGCGFENMIPADTYGMHKDEKLSDKLSDKLARLQREAAENQNSISRQTNDRGVR